MIDLFNKTEDVSHIPNVPHCYILYICLILLHFTISFFFLGCGALTKWLSLLKKETLTFIVLVLKQIEVRSVSKEKKKTKNTLFYIGSGVGWGVWVVCFPSTQLQSAVNTWLSWQDFNQCYVESPISAIMPLVVCPAQHWNMSCEREASSGRGPQEWQEA